MEFRPIAYEEILKMDDKNKTNFKGIGFGYGKRSDFTFLP
jgi:hypothetical protein